MKTKFETNVAEELPKTRNSQEPGLPWKVSSEDLEKVASMDSEYKAVITGVPPFKVRAIFLAALIAAIFIAILYFVSSIIVEDESVRTAFQKKEQALAVIQTNLSKINSEKIDLNKSIEDLQKKVSDLTAQKDLFTAVIESLAKKSDEPQADKDRIEAPVPAPVADNPAAATEADSTINQ